MLLVRKGPQDLLVILVVLPDLLVLKASSEQPDLDQPARTALLALLDQPASRSSDRPASWGQRVSLVLPASRSPERPAWLALQVLVGRSDRRGLLDLLEQPVLEAALRGRKGFKEQPVLVVATPVPLGLKEQLDLPSELLESPEQPASLGLRVQRALEQLESWEPLASLEQLAFKSPEQPVSQDQPEQPASRDQPVRAIPARPVSLDQRVSPQSALPVLELLDRLDQWDRLVLPVWATPEWLDPPDRLVLLERPALESSEQPDLEPRVRSERPVQVVEQPAPRVLPECQVRSARLDLPEPPVSLVRPALSDPLGHQVDRQAQQACKDLLVLLGQPEPWEQPEPGQPVLLVSSVPLVSQEQQEQQGRPASLDPVDQLA